MIYDYNILHLLQRAFEEGYVFAKKNQHIVNNEIVSIYKLEVERSKINEELNSIYNGYRFRCNDIDPFDRD